ncbi:MAG: GPP34 family phosphoprotein [Bacteroidales bacterium]|nr:GPP34 family phosphoprotein [Bacteroidales bacterium]
MENLKIKDLLILLCIHPEKGWVRKNSVIEYALIAAAMFDMVLLGKLNIVTGRIEATPHETGDPVLDDLLSKLSGLNGKKFSWLMNGLSTKAGKIYRNQLNYLENTRQISSWPVEWLGITWGKRYRVNRSDRLKPILTIMDRVLIYGRKPDLKMRLLIELLGSLNVLGQFFPDGELRKRAKQRFRQISKLPYEDHKDTFKAIGKELQQTLQMKKASSGT